MRTREQQTSTHDFDEVDLENKSSLPSVMPLSEFLPALFRALSEECVQFCVLRNYEGFPIYNSGRDIDFLIRASDLPLAIRALKSIQGIRVVGYSERSYVASVFLEGISSAAQSRALQVDFDLSLTWKGLVYLPTDAVLREAIAHPAGNSTFLAPSAVHEAIISLLTSLIIGGSVKEKYFPQVQRTFLCERSAVVAALSPQFGAETSIRLVDAVIGGDRKEVHGCVRALRASLVLRNILRRPLHSAAAVVRHYACEVAIRYSPRSLQTVRILSPGSSDRIAIIDALLPMLQSSAVVVEKRSSSPQLLSLCDSPGRGVPVKINAETSYCRSVVMAKVVSWATREWLSQLNKMPTLRITESPSHDLTFGAEEHRYGIPQWFAWLIGKLFPAPDLWILLDLKAEEMPAANHESHSVQTSMQLEACRSFVKTKEWHVILDAGKPVDCVTEEVYSAIVNMLAQRTDRLLTSRF
jgi:hypothetical protein